MIEIINSTVGKLQQIEDKYYYSLDLNYYLNNLEEDVYKRQAFTTPGNGEVKDDITDDSTKEFLTVTTKNNNCLLYTSRCV